MTDLHGDITTFLAAQGRTESDPLVQAAITALGATYEVREYDDDAVPARYLIFRDTGADILLEGGVVAAVFVYPSGDAEHAPYAAADRLIEGVAADSSRPQIRQSLGAPYRESGGYDLYEAGGRFVHFEYNGDVLSQVTVMAADPLAPRTDDLAGVSVQPNATASRPLYGELPIFVDALGSTRDSRELATVVALAGAEQMDHEQVSRDGVDWLYVYFRDGGVDLQFRDGTLVGVLIHVSREDGGRYPRPEALIEGLPLPTDASTVREFLGTPAVSSPTSQPGESFDLFNIDDDHAISFDYRDDQVVSVTVLQRGVGAAA